MCGEPGGYDREFTTLLSYPAQRRIGYSHERGTVTRFVVQLEYVRDDGLREIVRFDHNPDTEHGHDVTEDGVHIDVYRDGRKIRTEEIFPPMAADEALTFAEEHLAEHAQRYIERYEQWHGTRNR